MSNLHSCVGDIWSENGISILAVMGYWITKNMQLREKLLVVIGWEKDRHTGDNIKAKTLEGLHKTWGIDNLLRMFRIVYLVARRMKVATCLRHGRCLKGLVVLHTEAQVLWAAP